MKACWDPEFEPRSWTVDDIMAILFFGELALRGDFPIQSSTRQVEVMSGSTGSSRAPPILCNTEYAQFVDVSEVDI